MYDLQKVVEGVVQTVGGKSNAGVFECVRRSAVVGAGVAVQHRMFSETILAHRAAVHSCADWSSHHAQQPATSRPVVKIIQS